MGEQYIVKGGKRILVHAGATLVERKAKYAYCRNHKCTRDEARRLMDWQWDKIQAWIAHHKTGEHK